jgi:hypothetical protein
MTDAHLEFSVAETYMMPEGGWTCFHCGDSFTTIGAAQDHFGETPGATSACRIKSGNELGLVMELRKAEVSRDEWMEQALQSRGEIERLECNVESLTTAMRSYKPFQECRSINDAFFVYDSMEGRALAAEEQLHQFSMYDDSEPVLAALSSIADDLDATDNQRRAARMGIAAIIQLTKSSAASNNPDVSTASSVQHDPESFAAGERQGLDVTTPQQVGAEGKSNE